MIWFLYYTLMYLMVAGIGFSSLWDQKSRRWISGRKNWKEQLRHVPKKKGCRIWFHVASLGEFEQARPVIEKLKSANDDIDIILTFFSPSGYMVRSGYPLATVMYLPADLPGNAERWIEHIQPDIGVFVKYDLWPGYLRALHHKGIPSILFSAHWTQGGVFASQSLPPTKQLLLSFRQIFLQKHDDLEYFRQRGFDNLSAAGDTRIDRSLQLPAETDARLPELLKLVAPFDLVAGSTWPKDEKLLAEAVAVLNMRMLIAPHDVSEDNINRLIKSFPMPVSRLSELDKTTNNPKVIVVDSIGLLSVLYTLGKLAYVGGGFGSGIHNTLEPMAHKKPIIFGPAFNKFPEAVEMVRLRAGWPINNIQELIGSITQLQQPGAAEMAGQIAFDYLNQNKGASAKVANYILESIPCNPKG